MAVCRKLPTKIRRNGSNRKNRVVCQGDNRADLWTAHGIPDLVERSQSQRLHGTPPALSVTAVDAIGGGVYERLESKVVVPDSARASGDVRGYSADPVRRRSHQP